MYLQVFLLILSNILNYQIINCIHGSSPKKLSISELRTFLSYGHPLVPDCPDKRGLSVLLLCFSLVHANTIIAVMTFYFSKQIQNHSLT